MLREVRDDEVVIKTSDYQRLVKKAYWYDQIHLWTDMEPEPGNKEKEVSHEFV